MPKTLLTLCLSLFTITLQAQAELKGLTDPAVDKTLKNFGLKKENLFYSFIPIGKKETLKESAHEENHQSLSSFVPASLTKIFTALYALKKLGPDYRFETQVLIKGKIEQGILKGDLILKGGGDPSLTMARLMDMVLEVRKLGITKVEGSLIYDDSLFKPKRMLSEFGAGDQTYNPGMSALNLEFNRITLFRKSKDNYVAIPPLPHQRITTTQVPFNINQRFHSSNEDNNQEVWQLNKKIRYRQKEDIPVREVSKNTAESFRYLLSLWNIETPTSRNGFTPKGSKIVAINHSINLVNLLALTLEYSNNLYAEQILLSSSGKSTLSQAAKDLSQWLKESTPSCDLPLKNGSGLTTEHLITARCLSEFLSTHAFSTSDHPASRGFMSLLSINGISGWMKNRLDKPTTGLKVWAKTGNLDYISNVAGVLFADSGQAYAFTMALNDKEKRGIIDDAHGKKPKELPMAKRIQIDKTQKGATRWTRKAKEATDKLLEHFIQTL
ncbi:MAG: D-alanyl-D-alanine carboxypeptidase/D-alanyl-D-alanine-endopeptidase [Bdellovibrionota bacterium]|nr:D-alanyl-D-alanine carboxypeptidase/D-alanyl-D-alanine-endopeptidase [Bdellovibrionota bacterium]